MKKLSWYKICLIFSAIQWTAWIVGIDLLAFYRLSGDSNFFWRIAEPYNSFMLLSSVVIPVLPILILVACIDCVSKKEKDNVKKVLILLLLNFVIWLVYGALFAGLTGGV